MPWFGINAYPHIRYARQIFMCTWKRKFLCSLEPYVVTKGVFGDFFFPSVLPCLIIIVCAVLSFSPTRAAAIVFPVCYVLILLCLIFCPCQVLQFQPYTQTTYLSFPILTIIDHVYHYVCMLVRHFILPSPCKKLSNFTAKLMHTMCYSSLHNVRQFKWSRRWVDRVSDCSLGICPYNLTALVWPVMKKCTETLMIMFAMIVIILSLTLTTLKIMYGLLRAFP